jgi:hypothetical protein
LNSAEPALCQSVFPPFFTNVHAPFFWYCTKKRIQMFSLLPSPGARARTPIASGCFWVSQMLTVDHRFLTVAAFERCASSASAKGPPSARAARTGTEPRRIRGRETFMRIRTPPPTIVATWPSVLCDGSRGAA